MQSTLERPSPVSPSLPRDAAEAQLHGLFSWRGAGRLLLAVNCLALLTVAIGLRCWRLGSLPGINGDEAWMGVNALEFLHGGQVYWRTPSGNLLNPFLFLPQVFLHAIFLPSFTLLRIPAVASGILALIVNFWLCRRVFGKQAAVISTMILAILPINIAYSRFAWDACESLLFTLPCVYLPLMAAIEPARRWRWLGWSVASLGAAIWVHPTNCFVAPLLAAPWVADWRRLAAAPSSKNFLAVRNARILILVLLGAVLVGCRILRLVAYGSPQWVFSLAEIISFGKRFSAFFSGNTIYQFVAGSLSEYRWEQGDGIALDTLVRASGALALYGLFARCRGRSPDRPQRSGPIQALFCCWIAVIASFFLVAGADGLKAHVERYGMCLIAPTVLVAALGLQWWLLRRRFVGSLVFLTAGWCLLAGFNTKYVQALLQGSGGHDAFLTGSVDPKQAAYEYIADHHDPARRLEIIAADWWTYWPIRYLTEGQPRISVIPGARVAGETVSEDFAIDQFDYWEVGFDLPCPQILFSVDWRDAVARQSFDYRRIELLDPLRKKALSGLFLYHVEADRASPEKSSPNPENN